MPDNILSLLKRWDKYRGQIVHHQVVPGKPPSYQRLSEEQEAAARVLLPSGAAGLYQHQALALQKALQGKHLVLATATASGKTLALTLPGFLARVKQPDARILCIVPTRALAEQWRQQLADWDPKAAVDMYTGDTPKSQRAAIRRRVHWLVTTPDMLHVGILPNHMLWHGFFSRLQSVIVDESHIYRGVLGSHMAHVLRRLHRVARSHGAPPVTYLFASATIGNPSEHTTELLGLPVVPVTEDGAPSGPRNIALWQPPHERGHSDEAAAIMAYLAEHGIRTILFGQARQSVERMLLEVCDRLPSHMAGRVMPYRAGYMAEERRTIERRLASGDLLGVVTTNALELGIDIGSLDVSILDGFPGSLSSFWQQSGRAGRGERGGFTILVLRQDALDQYFASHPERLLGSAVEHARLNVNNPYILPSHLLCAAYERAVGEDELDSFGVAAREAVSQLASVGRMSELDGKYRVSGGSDSPAAGMSLRQAGERLRMIDAATGKQFEETDVYHAISECYPGAVYISKGSTYVARSLDVPAKEVELERREVDYYTDATGWREVLILEQQGEVALGNGCHLNIGRVRTTEHITGFAKYNQRSRVVVGHEELEEPLALPLETIAFWITVPADGISTLLGAGRHPAGSLHAAEHALIALLPLFVLGDRRDVGGVSILPEHPQTRQATIFIYDGYPGGIGYAEGAYQQFKDLARATQEAIAACSCEDGCYACVQSPKCGSENRPLDKAGAIRLLSMMLDG